jgi:hypothetical protein
MERALSEPVISSPCQCWQAEAALQLLNQSKAMLSALFERAQKPSNAGRRKHEQYAITSAAAEAQLPGNEGRAGAPQCPDARRPHARRYVTLRLSAQQQSRSVEGGSLAGS